LVGPGIEFDVPWRLYGYGRDRAKAARSYEGLLRPDPIQPPYVLNLGLIYQTRRDFAAAESIYRAILRGDTANAIAYSPLFESVFDQGKFAAAESLSALARHRYSNKPIGVTIEGTILYFRNRHAELEAFIHNCLNGSPVVRRLCLEASADYSLTRGRVNDFKEYRKQAREMGIAFGVISPIVDSVLLAFVDIEVLRDREQAVRRLDAAVALGNSLPPLQREYLAIAEGYARAGEPNKARSILRRNAAAVTDLETEHSERPLVDAVSGYIALATHNARSARQYFRRADILPDGPVNDCGPCLPVQLGYAYDVENQTDSAITMFEKYLNVPHSTRPWELKVDPISLAHVYERLGQLYEQEGKNKEAKTNYTKFVQLWSDADPVLQPRVSAARRRLIELDSLDRLQSR
jgi:tetratricopeptide (TPR) repeat protein